MNYELVSGEEGRKAMNLTPAQVLTINETVIGGRILTISVETRITPSDQDDKKAFEVT